MSAVSLVFAPQLPWWLLLALGVTALLLVGLSFWRRARGAAWRAVFLTLVLLFLANPILRREQREPLDDLVLMVSDRSPSQRLGERPAQLDASCGSGSAACPASNCARCGWTAKAARAPACSRASRRRWPKAIARGWER
jgi:hypothetical protein